MTRICSLQDMISILREVCSKPGLKEWVGINTEIRVLKLNATWIETWNQQFSILLLLDEPRSTMRGGNALTSVVWLWRAACWKTPKQTIFLCRFSIEARGVKKMCVNAICPSSDRCTRPTSTAAGSWIESSSVGAGRCGVSCEKVHFRATTQPETTPGHDTKAGRGHTQHSSWQTSFENSVQWHQESVGQIGQFHRKFLWWEIPPGSNLPAGAYQWWVLQECSACRCSMVMQQRREVCWRSTGQFPQVCSWHFGPITAIEGSLGTKVKKIRISWSVIHQNPKP